MRGRWAGVGRARWSSHPKTAIAGLAVILAVLVGIAVLALAEGTEQLLMDLARMLPGWPYC
jgi:hypothetical protein